MAKKKDYSYLVDIIKLTQNEEIVDELDKLNIKYESNFFDQSDIAKVSSNVASILLRSPKYNVSIKSNEQVSETELKQKNISSYLSKNLDKVDLLFTHFDKPIFKAPLENTAWVVFQNWDFGSTPKEWKIPFNNYIDRIIVSSNYNKDNLIRDGISEEKIKVLNTAVDSIYYNQNVESTDLKITKKVKFLFKGDLSWKSGFDLLLKAYNEEFSNKEDVALIISTKLDLIDQQNSENIKKILSNPENPYISIIEEPITQKDSAKLYKACDYLVSPHRANSYCINIIESMACGVPVIVTGDGSAIDYCTKEESILLEPNLVHDTKKEVEKIETVYFPYWFETDVEEIKLKLRQAFNNTEEEYNELSLKASKRILNNFTQIKLKENIDVVFSQLKGIITQSSIQNKINIQITEALSYLNNKDYNLAFDKLKDLLYTSPENPDINFYLANLHFNNKNYSSALDHLLISLNHNSNNEDYTNLTGVLLYKIQCYDLAKKFFDFTLINMPDHQGAKQSREIIKNSNLINDERNLYPNQKEAISKIINYFKKSQLPTVSVCILAKNEEKNIERAIRSSKKFADEIIVLDTGSTDRTVEIAEKLGTIVIHSEWKSDFSYSRNELMTHATGDWIIMLDADEAFAEKTVDKIKPILMTLNDKKVGTIKIVNFLDKNGILEKFEHYVTRVIPNNKKFLFERAIHENVVTEEGYLPNSEILRSIEILHYGYSTNIVKEKNKVQRNREILERCISDEPDDFLNYFYLSENYKDENNFEKVVELSYKALETIDDFLLYRNIVEACEINIIEALINLNVDKQEFNDCSNRVEPFLEKRADYWFLKGNYYLGNNEFDLAISFYKKALDLRTQNISSSIDLGTIGWKSLYNIANAYNKKGDKEKTLTYINRALRSTPNNDFLTYQSLLLYIEYEELEKINPSFKSIYLKINTSLLIDLVNKIKNLFIEKNLITNFYSILEDIRKKYFEESKENLQELKQFIIEQYQYLHEIFPENNAVLYSLAYCYNSIGDDDKSKEIFEQIIKSNDFEVDSLHNIASIYINKNDLEKAEATYKKVLEIDAFHCDSYISLAKLELSRKNSTQAQEYLEKLKEIDPDNEMINLLSFELALLDENKKTASDMYSAMLFVPKNN